jgi:Protein of unknown function (DUF2490)
LRTPFVALVFAAACCAQAPPENTSTQFWPEVDFYWKFATHLRLVEIAQSDRQLDEPYTQPQFTTRLDIFVPRFRPLLFPRLVQTNDERMQRITIGIGYLYGHSLHTERTKIENRAFAEITLRWALLERILLSNRSRFEFRFVNGVYSWRFRDRVRLERDLSLHGHPFTVYISAESFYDSDPGDWNRFAYKSGLVIPFAKCFEFEPYYQRQVTLNTTPRNVNGIGAVLHIYTGQRR